MRGGYRDGPKPSLAVFEVNGKEATIERTDSLHIGQKIRVYYRDSLEYGILVDYVEGLPSPPDPHPITN